MQLTETNFSVNYIVQHWKLYNKCSIKPCLHEKLDRYIRIEIA